MLAADPSRLTASGVTSPARILIVGSDWITVRGMQHALETAGHIVSEVVSSGDEALASASREVPDLAVVEIAAGALADGIELAHQLHSRFDVASVIVTDRSAIDGLARVTGTAVAGVVVKPFHEHQLLSVVAVACNRHRPSVARLRGGAARSPEGRAPTASAPGERGSRLREVALALAEPVSHRQVLTRRELEVVRLLMANGRVRTIAEQLHISPHTVRNQLRSVFRKLGVHSQVELIQRLRE